MPEKLVFDKWIEINEPQDTILLAREMSKILNFGDYVELLGELGAGKSFFARYLIREILKDDNHEVPSPTFSLVQIYETNEQNFIYHVDLYRLNNELEILSLDLPLMQQKRPDNILSLIEWSSRAKNILPKPDYIVQFRLAQNNRQIRVSKS